MRCACGGGTEATLSSLLCASPTYDVKRYHLAVTWSARNALTQSLCRATCSIVRTAVHSRCTVQVYNRFSPKLNELAGQARPYVERVEDVFERDVLPAAKDATSKAVPAITVRARACDTAARPDCAHSLTALPPCDPLSPLLCLLSVGGQLVLLRPNGGSTQCAPFCWAPSSLVQHEVCPWQRSQHAFAANPNSSIQSEQTKQARLQDGARSLLKSTGVDADAVARSADSATQKLGEAADRATPFVYKIFRFFASSSPEALAKYAAIGVVTYFTAPFALKLLASGFRGYAGASLCCV